MTTNRNVPTSDSEELLVRRHLGLVRRVVSDVASRMPRHARDDLVSAGMFGLAQAARNFDPSRGVPFERYAATRVKGALLDELRSNDWASRPVRAKARRMDAATEKLTASLGRRPSPEEVAGAMGVDVSRVETLTQDLHRATVLNYESLLRTGDGEAVLLVDGDTPEDRLLDREANAYLVDAVRALPQRLRVVVIGYFFEDRPMREIAGELGVSESRVSQLRSEALDLLREGMNSQLDPSALPEPSTSPRVARRKQAYFAAIAGASTPAARLDSRPRPETAAAGA